MKFLVDAQLPARLAGFLNRAGHDAVHRIALPDGNRSTDRQIAQLADADGRRVYARPRTGRPLEIVLHLERPPAPPLLEIGGTHETDYPPSTSCVWVVGFADLIVGGRRGRAGWKHSWAGEHLQQGSSIWAQTTGPGGVEGVREVRLYGCS